jgi:hypothetical protein
MPQQCIACRGTGQITTFCREYAPRPGTSWDMIHDSSTGASWCFNCGAKYNDHGAPSDIAAAFKIPDEKRHLICPPPTGPCIVEAGHASDHQDEHGRRWGKDERPIFWKAPEIKNPLMRVPRPDVQT